jgi:hypothetical protein
MKRSRPRPINSLLRKALWEAHKRRCVYDGREISELDQMHVDHILPQWLWKPDAKDELTRVFAALELGADYHPDSLDNLVPVRELRNKQKGAWLFDERDARFFRKIATEKSDEVEHLCRKFEDAEEQERIRSEAEAACTANPTLRGRLLAALAATEPFETENYTADDRVRFSRPRVLLDCLLPKKDDYGSLVININTLYLHRVQLTLDARQILTSLLCGWGTAPTLKQRGFSIGPRADFPNEWIVRIAGATIFLTKDELGQLCDVVDLLAPRFLQALLAREVTQGTLTFAPDGPENVRLLRVKRSLWGAILDFAREHDYAQGSSPWHVFDALGHGHIKTVRRTASGDVIPFETYIYPITPLEYGPKCEALDEVCLCWNASRSRICTGDSERSDMGWTATAAHRWLVEKLIPEVVRRNTPLLQRFRQWAAAGDPPRFHSETTGVDLDALAPVRDWPALTRFAELAQEHFNSHPQEPVCRAVMDSALAILALLADNLNVGAEHVDYYATKLGVEHSGTLAHRVAASRRKHAAQLSFDGFDLDVVLRCVWGVLKDHAPEAGTLAGLFAQVSTVSAPLVDALRWDVIRHRSIARIEHTSAWI